MPLFATGTVMYVDHRLVALFTLIETNTRVRFIGEFTGPEPAPTPDFVCPNATLVYESQDEIFKTTEFTCALGVHDAKFKMAGSLGGVTFDGRLEWPLSPAVSRKGMGRWTMSS
ncbi:hypothetical protein JR316_0007551 [Psilocybe cubensis]|uniref:Uncharacterized protein n=2 Tax=Psilocybe cubensis TaxID=181762 RepID=A0ACB8GZQ8_PSICU|nr:hypothetical protein JR316_0007551 [Psilocybe cubensis]KAH9480944.1 hypothetical protein JR316_0007551 [Psilocybe cubensis]